MKADTLAARSPRLFIMMHSSNGVLPMSTQAAGRLLHALPRIEPSGRLLLSIWLQEYIGRRLRAGNPRSDPARSELRERSRYLRGALADGRQRAIRSNAFVAGDLSTMRRELFVAYSLSCAVPVMAARKLARPAERSGR